MSAARVREYEKVFVQELHLHDGFLREHGFEIKALYLDDLRDPVLMRGRRRRERR